MNQFTPLSPLDKLAYLMKNHVRSLAKFTVNAFEKRRKLTYC